MKNLAFLCFINVAIVEKILIGNTCRAGQLLLAALACAALAQSAYAGSQSAASETSTGSIANSHNHTTQTHSPLKSKNKNELEVIDYTNICIFCHIPNMVKKANVAPVQNNAIKFSTKPIQKTKSELP